MTDSHPPHGTPDVFGEYDIKIQQEEKMLFNSFGEPFKLAVVPESPVTIQISPRAGSTISTDPELLAAIILRHAWGGGQRMSNPITINFTLDDGATAPTRAHDTDAGLDLYSSRGCPISPGERRLVSTGVHVAIPPGYVGMICPRSGLAHKHGLTVLNAPGIIDAGYTGEIKVNLHNTGDALQHVDAGDRIAQLVITPIPDAQLEQVDSLEATERGDNGHGSTGQ